MDIRFTVKLKVKVNDYDDLQKYGRQFINMIRESGLLTAQSKSQIQANDELTLFECTILNVVDTTLDICIALVRDRLLTSNTSHIYHLLSMDTGVLELFTPSRLLKPSHQLFEIIKAGDIPALQELIDQGQDIRVHDSSGSFHSPLSCALAYKQLPMAKFLLGHGFAPDRQYGRIGNNPLHLVAAEGLLEGLELLLPHRAACLHHRNFRGATPLILAAYNLKRLQKETVPDRVAIDTLLQVIKTLFKHGAGIGSNLMDFEPSLILPEYPLLAAQLPTEHPAFPNTQIDSFLKIASGEQQLWLQRLRLMRNAFSRQKEHCPSAIHRAIQILSKLSPLSKLAMDCIAGQITSESPPAFKPPVQLGAAELSQSGIRMNFFYKSHPVLPDQLSQQLLTDVNVLFNLSSHQVKSLQESCNRKGAIEYRQKNFKEATHYFQHALDFHVRLLQHSPKQPPKNTSFNIIEAGTQLTARFYHNLACAHENCGDQLSAAYCFNNAKRIYARLITQDIKNEHAELLQQLIKEQARLDAILSTAPRALSESSFEQEHLEALLTFFNGTSPDQDEFKYISGHLLELHHERCIYSGIRIKSSTQAINAVINAFDEVVGNRKQ